MPLNATGSRKEMWRKYTQSMHWHSIAFTVLLLVEDLMAMSIYGMVSTKKDFANFTSNFICKIRILKF